MIENKYLTGSVLRGDDFSIADIEIWFNDEKEGYANLGAKNHDTYKYVYHELNKNVCFNALKQSKYSQALGIGSAYGDEFKPIINKIDTVTIIDPSDSFSKIKTIYNTSCKYVKPTLNGDLPFEDETFDLITVFGVFHHIPNVSHVFQEAFRILKKDGIMCIREPIVSMGDWSEPRKGLTKNERGIPYKIFLNIANDCGFKIEKQSLCDFPPLTKVLSKFGISIFTHKNWTKLDILLSKLFAWNINYHPNKFTDYFRPASLALVLKK